MQTFQIILTENELSAAIIATRAQKINFAAKEDSISKQVHSDTCSLLDILEAATPQKVSENENFHLTV
jgi:hypothetical protein